MKDVRQGGCLCGKARYSIDLSGSETGNCHCRDCQKQSGAPFAMVTTVKASQLKWISEPSGTVSISEQAIRRFCEHCGTPLQWCGHDYADIANMNTATLDDTSDLTVSYEIYTRSRMKGIEPVFGAAQSLGGYEELD